MTTTVSVSDELLREFKATLAPRLAGDLRIDAVTRALYATDASMYQMMPVGVLLPRHAGDVQAAVEQAAAFGIPVLPRGGGSSLAGQTVGAALVIDFSRHLNEVVEVDEEQQWVRLQPGVTLDVLNAHLAPRGLMMGPDPASSSRATLGGMTGNNSTGTHSIIYGNVVNHLISLRGFLSDGTEVAFGPTTDALWAQKATMKGLEGAIYRGLSAVLADKEQAIRSHTPHHWRRTSGYRLEYLLHAFSDNHGDVRARSRGGAERNVAHLLCGSEGTLAVSAELQMGVVPRPAMTALAVVHFHTRTEALRAVTAILETGPSAVELFDGNAIAQARRSPGFADKLTFVEGEPGSILFTEYYGRSASELDARLDALDARLTAAGRSYAVVRVRRPDAIRNVWNVRKEGLGFLMGVKGDYKPVAFVEDASVPVEHLADYIEGLLTVLHETDTDAALYAHASAGCLHVRPFINTKDAGEVAKMKEIATASMELVRRYAGAVSSEHGDGLARSWLLEALVGPDLYQAYRDVKQLFDPHGQLNPGKVVDAPPMDHHLRMGPTYGTIPILEEQDWTSDGGFVAAVEQCNGNGACRKLLSGTMCPSYMATREEKHSTRGRANALRAALSGTLPVEALNDDRLYDVMDLCVECKACKAECPSNVDMAKIKTEWLNRYWSRNRVPLRTRLFARMPRLTRRIPAAAARLYNWMNARPALRSTMARSLGLSAMRTLPPIAPEPFTEWFRKQDWTSDGPPVVLFADTFNNYNHPHVARAAARFLQRIGYAVRVQDARACCGRPLISKGFLSDAQVQAMETVERLHPFAEQGIPIVGIEPSCILMFRDEYRSLLPGDVRTQQVAEMTLTFEEFVAHLAGTHALDHVHWTDDARHLLLHGHCHQKALVGTAPAEACLSLPPNFTLETVDSGCCGMAGAFGYEAEHYDVSVTMAEDRLAPAVRQASDETLIVAAGTSCRTQIFDVTGRKALHPAEVLLGALA